MRIILMIILFIPSITLIGQENLQNTKAFFNDLLIREVKNPETSEVHYQSVLVNDSIGLIVIKTMSNLKSDTLIIPFCSIAGVSEDWENQVLSIHQIGGNRVETPMILGTVRNVKGRMILELREAAKQSPELCQLSRIIHQTARSFVAAAVFEELVRINLDRNLVERVMGDNSLFVKKCNICDGSQKAFKDYVQYYEINSNKRADLPVLLSDNLEERLAALEELVAQSVDAYFIQHSYSEQETLAIREMLKNERQKSMNMTNGGSCASCNGACKLPGTN